MLPRGRRLLQEVAARAGAASGAPWTGESWPRARSAGETLTHTWHSLTVVDTHPPRTRLSLALIVGLSDNARGQVDTNAKTPCDPVRGAQGPQIMATIAHHRIGTTAGVSDSAISAAKPEIAPQLLALSSLASALARHALPPRAPMQRTRARVMPAWVDKMPNLPSKIGAKTTPRADGAQKNALRGALKGEKHCL